jgi:hypothetical protein
MNMAWACAQASTKGSHLTICVHKCCANRWPPVRQPSSKCVTPQNMDVHCAPHDDMHACAAVALPHKHTSWCMHICRDGSCQVCKGLRAEARS